MRPVLATQVSPSPAQDDFCHSLLNLWVVAIHCVPPPLRLKPALVVYDALHIKNLGSNDIGIAHKSLLLIRGRRAPGFL